MYINQSVIISFILRACLKTPERGWCSTQPRSFFIRGRISVTERAATLWVLWVLVVNCFTNSCHANLIAYEPFNYTTSIPDATASTATGFTGNWTCGTTPSVVAGLTYAALPTANNSLSSTSGRQSVSFASPLTSGTKWISFLFNMAGNNGGNICGIYFPNGGTGLFFGYGLNPITASTGALRPGSILTMGNAAQGATSLASGFTGTYGATPYLVVMRIDFNTSGANDTVTIYINPTANSATPGVAASYTVTTFDVGSITGIGFQNQGGGFAIKADEIRVGESYVDVVGSGAAPVAPVITGIAPITGLTNGGTVVTITGSNFLAGITVRFGANAGTSVSLAGSTSITATTPTGLPGAVNVVVANTNALAGTNVNGFTYVLPPLPLPPKLRGISTSDNLLKADIFALLTQTKANVIRLGFSVDSPNANPPTAQNPLAPYATNLAILDAALPLARAAGIKIVLCAAETYGWSQHMFQGSAADLATYRTNLATFWTAMAQRYLNEPAIVAYDLLNEPATDYFSQGAWYTNVLPAAVAAVRSVNPSIWLMVESEYWGQAGNFNTMPVLDDPYVIYSFHMYSPPSYTGQGVGSYVNYTPTYPGTNSIWGPADTNSIYTYWDKRALSNAMSAEINFSLAHPDKRILVGEFGVLRWSPGADRWLSDCIELFEQYGWDWCNHSPSGWNGFNATYAPNDQSTSQLPDGGYRGASWMVLLDGWQKNPITLAAPRLSGGQFQFDATGLTLGRTNLMQVSTNLISWTSISTNVATNFSMTFTNAVGLSGQFFRLIQLP